MLWLIALLALFVLAVHAIRLLLDRKRVNGNGASTGNGRVAASIEGEDLEDLDPEEQLLALATAVKNLRHRQGMLEGRLNRLSPPAARPTDPPSPAAPRTRADVLKAWRERNANPA